MQDVLALFQPFTPQTLKLLILLWTQIMIFRSPPNYRQEYDYIIVGGGVAGVTLAARLSEDSHTSVLLLEAGSYENFLTDIPFVVPALQGTAIDWQFRSTPQNHSCRLIDGRQSHWPQGKALGGTSVLNFMLYVRGNKRDYDRWVAAGAEGWSYDDNLPYFLRSEEIGISELLASRMC